VQTRTHWFVRMNRNRRGVHVHADYHVVEGGVLKFRNAALNTARGYNYPTNVIAFAPGEWCSVENLSVEKAVGN
jgi:hypothetical protein